MAEGNPAVVLIGDSARAAAEDAKRGGLKVIAIDRFGDRDLLSVCDTWIHFDREHRWLSRLSEFSFDSIIPLGGFHWSSRATRWFANSLSCSRRLRGPLIAYPEPAAFETIDSPGWLGRLAARCGVYFPETQQQIHGELLPIYQPAASSPLETSRWLWKPTMHGGGVGITVAGRERHRFDGYYLQRQLCGKPIGANFIAYQDAGVYSSHLLGAFRGITYRKNPEHRFLYGGSVGPIKLCQPVLNAITALGQAIAEQLPLVGLFNVDLMLGPSGELALLEVNPRYSASMELIPLAATSPRSLINWHLRCYQDHPKIADEIAEHAQCERQPPSTTVSCKRILYARADSQPTDQSTMEPSRHPNVEGDSGSIQLVYRDLPSEGTVFAAGDPVCTATATTIVSGAGRLRECIRLSAAPPRWFRPINGLASSDYSPRSSAKE